VNPDQRADTGLRYPALCPYLCYEDTPAAMDWLACAFGFQERPRSTDADGSIRHAEMELGDAVIMMAARQATRARRTSAR
jgi:uncharacterized glyoxalase superfamily protein PhnB